MTIYKPKYPKTQAQWIATNLTSQILAMTVWWIATIPRSARNLNDGIVWIAALVSLARNDE